MMKQSFVNRLAWLLFAGLVTYDFGMILTNLVASLIFIFRFTSKS